MRATLPRSVAAVLAILPLWAGAFAPRAVLAADRPAAIVDLRTAEGLSLVRGEWRYGDAEPVQVDGKGPGADLKPSGAPVRTWDIEPKAGAKDFDDSSWQVLDPAKLDARRGNGKLSFGWYRLRVTIPEKVGSFDTRGSTVAFEIVVDDYAEVWVDGRLPRVLGQTGGPMIRGFNAPNRVVVAREAKPGQEIRIAVFGANGPLSEPPSNFIWVKSATLDFHPAPKGADPAGTIERLAPALDAIVPKDAKIEKLAGGFLFTEGPVWVRDGGYLLFSDPNANVIYRWSEDDGVSVYRTKSGYTGADVGDYGQPGSNGLAFDPQGRLTICEHGNRRVTRLEKNGQLTVLADRYQGKRLNSPNDLVYRSDGVLCFSDPPFGLPKFHADPRKELATSGIFCSAQGELRLVSDELSGPNGLAFTPDEKFLYVDDWDEKKKVVMRYPLDAAGHAGKGEVFYDMTSAPGEEALDGLKVDERGDVFVSGPGGVWILSPEGKHLGTIRATELAANFAWGDDDGRTLYLTARTGLYRLRLSVAGAPFANRR